jgi:hypothetical protein
MRRPDRCILTITRTDATIVERRRRARRRRGTMGLFLSDAMLIDPMLDDVARLRDRLSEWTFATDAARDTLEYDGIDPTE